MDHYSLFHVRRKDFFYQRDLRCRIFEMTAKGFCGQVMVEDVLVEEKKWI